MSASCPFCGANAVRFDHAATLAGTFLHWAECRQCRARGPHVAPGRDHANAAWSARAYTPLEKSLHALVAAQEVEFREELASERERVRRWRARLRWRAKNGGPYWREEAEDRLLQRADMSDAKRREMDERPLYLCPIAGPKPGRFLP